MKSSPNKKTAALIALAFFVSPHAARAEGAAPALYGVHDIVLQYTHFLYPQASDSCALTRDEIARTINAVLQDAKVPATLVSEAKPPQFGTARIDLIPEIASMNGDGLDCTSWVSLTAESQSNVKIMPIDTLRNVTVVYWHVGTLVNSGQSTHARTVADALQKMTTHFAQDYKVAQPAQ